MSAAHTLADADEAVKRFDAALPGVNGAHVALAICVGQLADLGARIERSTAAMLIDSYVTFSVGDSTNDATLLPGKHCCKGFRSQDRWGA